MIDIGQRLPDADVIRVTAEGQETLGMADYLASKTVAIFAMPGAFTSTCSCSHLPNIIKHKEELYSKSVDDIAVLVVNDAFVVREWGKHSGAFDAGLTMISDASAGFTIAIGMNFTVSSIGYFNRSQRYALLSEDGIAAKFLLEEARAKVLSSGANHLLEHM